MWVQRLGSLLAEFPGSKNSRKPLYPWQWKQVASVKKNRACDKARQIGRSDLMGYETDLGVIGFRVIPQSLLARSDCPDWAKAAKWLAIPGATFTGDPVQDGLITPDELSRLREEARQFGVENTTHWTYEAETYLVSWNAEWARSQFVVSASEDVAARWLATYQIGPQKGWWNMFLPLAMALYPEGDLHREATWSPKIGQHSSSLHVRAPNGLIIGALSTSLKQQGDTGDIYIDEAAISDYGVQEELFAVLSPISTRGFKYTLSSRHNGASSPFAREILKAQRDPLWDYFRVTIFDACVQGCREIDGSLVWPSELAAKCPSEDDFRQQYLCEPTVGGAALIEHAIIRELDSRARKPVAYYRFDDDGNMKEVAFIKDDDWGLMVWRPPAPGQKYVIGADYASGRTGDNHRLNRTAFDVSEVTTGTTVAEACGRVLPEIAARCMMEVGRYYNMAFLVPENRESGMTALGVICGNDQKMVPRYDLSRLYRTKTTYDRAVMRYGYLTTNKTRPTLLNGLVFWINKVAGAGMAEWPNRSTIAQASTLYLSDSKNRPKIEATGQDDRMFAKALSLVGCEYLRNRTFAEAPPDRPWERVEPRGLAPEHDPVLARFLGQESTPDNALFVGDGWDRSAAAPDHFGGWGQFGF